MPRYDYRCDNCLVTTEVQRSFHIEPEAPLCPKCDKPMQRVFDATPAIFKGDGWAAKS